MLPLDAYDREDLHNKRPTLSRSYGSKLQSSFAWDLSNALVYSTYPPVSVSSTNNFVSSLSSFSCEHSPSNLRHQFSDQRQTDFSSLPTYNLKQESNYLLRLSFSTLASLHKIGAGILTCFPSTTPFGLALGSDLP